MNIPNNPESHNVTPDQQENEQIKKIADLNDHLRVTGLGGRVITTLGIASLPKETQIAITQAVRTFSEFNESNDPYKEHDSAILSVKGVRIKWKIDYYDQTMLHHSLNKADPNVTKRVMTIMLAGI